MFGRSWGKSMRCVSDWRSPNIKDAFVGFDFADFAQEFLCRNADYEHEYRQTMVPTGMSDSGQIHEMEVLARRWGLCFPLRPRSKPA